MGAGTDKPYSAGGVVGCIVFAVIGAIYAEVDLGEWREYQKGLAVFEAKKRELTPQGFTPMSSEVAGVKDLEDTDFPYLPARILRRVAEETIKGRPFASKHYRGILTDGEFEDVREKFIGRHIIEWKNPQAHKLGTHFTPAGWMLMKQKGTPPNVVSVPEMGLTPVNPSGRGPSGRVNR